MKNETNKPEKKFRVGSVSATVWSNELKKDGKEFTVKSVTIERSYQDKDGNWQVTNSYKQNDLPKLRLVAQKAYAYISSGDL